MMQRILKWNRFAVVGCALVGQAAAGGMTVAVSASVLSPAPVATQVTFTAVVSGEPTANNWYRFSVREGSGPYQIIRDYGPVNTLMWTASQHEGTYEIEVDASNLDSGDMASGSAVFEFSPIASSEPVISPTANSLIFLYSAPPCPTGWRIHVEFTGPSGIRQATPFEDCNPVYTANFYLAGLLAGVTYTAQHVLDRDTPQPVSAAAEGSAMGPQLTFTTGSLPSNLYSDTILTPSSAGASNPYLLGSVDGGIPVANDLAGNVVWYGPNLPTWLLTNPEPGGAMWGVVEVMPADPAQELIRKIDLTGMTLLETNAARVNEQLGALGKRQISGFHHEARTLPDGNIAVLADVEQILTNVQGPGPLDVIGDMIIVFNQNLNVVWTWDTFDFLDVTRKAVLGETCATEGGCAPYALSSNPNDWTHGNAITATPDGNLLYSTRNQDWVIKVSYDQGNGDGHIIWKMGVDGDFGINSTDPYPWFSHQHDPNFEISNPSMLLVFDDGNTRVSVEGGGNSRGQALQVDEQNLVVTPVLNANLGYYAEAVGAAQLLLDGDYHFDIGFVQENNTIDSYSLEVAPSGQIVYNAHQNTILYRTFRMASMYSVN
jgi:arylsulfate sulfotransferase